MNTHVIIVAGGIGKRMGAQKPKQFLLLDNKPILVHTLQKFYQVLPNALYYVVLPESFQKEWEKICKSYSVNIPHSLIKGGAERFFSVKNALNKIEEKEGWVLIHDAVRPLVSTNTILNTLELSKQKGAAIPAIPLTDSIRKLTINGSEHLCRKDYVLVQTPQCFDLSIIKKAYCVNYNPLFTDDASVLENLGYNIELAQGNKENIKITSPEDLIIAEAFLRNGI